MDAQPKPSSLPDNARIKPTETTVYSITAELKDENSLAKPDAVHATTKVIPFSKDLAIPLPAYTTAVVEIKSE